MEIELHAKDKNEYLEKISFLFGFQRARKKIFINLLLTFWADGIASNMRDLKRKYPEWAGDQMTMIAAFKVFKQLGIITKKGYNYHINPDLLITEGETRITYIFQIGDVKVVIDKPEAVKVAKVKPPKQKKIKVVQEQPQAEAKPYINPRYENIV